LPEMTYNGSIRRHCAQYPWEKARGLFDEGNRLPMALKSLSLRSFSVEEF
jgi:hypothetical protein